MTAVVAALACWAAVDGAPTAVTAPLGIALFVAVGYVLGRLLLSPDITGLERFVVSTGLALAVPILGGLALYAAGVPLHRPAWLGLVAGATAIADVLLLLSRWLGWAAPFNWHPGWHLPLRHTLIFAAAVLVAGGAVALARIGVAVQPQPGFTQLWLSPQGHNVHTASLGVSNDQGSLTRYRLVLLRNGQVSATWNLTLADGQTWQRAVPFTGTYGLAANLYRLPDLSQPYRYVSTGSDKGAGL